MNCFGHGDWLTGWGSCRGLTEDSYGSIASYRVVDRHMVGHVNLKAPWKHNLTEGSGTENLWIQSKWVLTFFSRHTLRRSRARTVYRWEWQALDWWVSNTERGCPWIQTNQRLLSWTEAEKYSRHWWLLADVPSRLLEDPFDSDTLRRYSHWCNCSGKTSNAGENSWLRFDKFWKYRSKIEWTCERAVSKRPNKIIFFHEIAFLKHTLVVCKPGEKKTV